MGKKSLWSENIKAAYFVKAVGLYYEKQFAKAILFLSRALEIDCNYDDAYYFRGLSFERKGDIASALCDYRRALSIRGGLYFATYLLAFQTDPRYLFISYGNSNGCSWWEKAISDYTRPIPIAEREALFYCKEGTRYNAHGDLSRSIMMYSKALKIDPLNVFGFFQRAGVWNTLGKYERAISDYGEALNLNPRFAKAYYSRGQIYFRKNQHDKAYDDFDKARSLGYKHPKFLEELEYRMGMGDL
jgi:tetratricopeptide (TPR) repeat protein